MDYHADIQEALGRSYTVPDDIDEEVRRACYLRGENVGKSRDDALIPFSSFIVPFRRSCLGSLMRSSQSSPWRRRQRSRTRCRLTCWCARASALCDVSVIVA